MKLEFDSIDDLNHFLNWAETFRGKPTHIVHLAGGGGGSGGEAIPVTISGVSGASGVADTGDAPRMPPPVSGDPTGACLQPNDAAQQDHAPKRKRRTKAEIEADNAADAAADAERAAHAAQEAAEVAAKGANPFEQPAAGGTEAPVPPAETAPAADAGTESDAEEVVTPFQHITRARAYIAKYGTANYGESFAKAGLDANVMAYTAYQRALHVATLDEMDKT